MSYTEQMANRRLTAASKVLFARVIDNENEAAARLSLPPTSRVIKLERLRHSVGEPFALETCYLNAAEFSGLLDAAIGSESLFGILEHDCKVELGYADEEIDATTADPKIAELLAIPRREPVLRIRQVIYSTKGNPVMYVLGFYRADRHNLVIRRFR
jgi:GntR family transcriptional regulator